MPFVFGLAVYWWLFMCVYVCGHMRWAIRCARRAPQPFRRDGSAAPRPLLELVVIRPRARVSHYGLWEGSENEPDTLQGRLGREHEDDRRNLQPVGRTTDVGAQDHLRLQERREDRDRGWRRDRRALARHEAASHRLGSVGRRMSATEPSVPTIAPDEVLPQSSRCWKNWSLPNLKALVKYLDQGVYIDRTSLESLAMRTRLLMLVEAGTDQPTVGDSGCDRVQEMGKLSLSDALRSQYLDNGSRYKVFQGAVFDCFIDWYRFGMFVIEPQPSGVSRCRWVSLRRRRSTRRSSRTTGAHGIIAASRRTSLSTGRF